MKYTIESNKITLRNDFSVTFDHDIGKALPVEEVIIIITKSPFTPVRIIENLNVYAISTSGKILWRIGETKLFGNSTISEDCPYVDALVNDKGELVLFNWCDTAVIVDPQTGDILRTYVTK